MVGPTSSYKRYDDLLADRVIEEAAKKGDTRLGMPRGRRMAAAQRFLTGLFFIGLFGAFSSRYDYSMLLKPAWSNRSLFARICFVQAAGFAARFKYYAIWSLAEGAIILTGMSYNGEGDKAGVFRWDGCRNINILGVELAQNWKILLDNWNMVS